MLDNINWRLVVGAVLVGLGGLLLLDNLFDLSVGRFLWPFFIIIPGVLLFLAALNVEEGLGEAFAMLSGIITMTGLLLFYQSVTGHWASWAYAWALIAPTSVGLAQIMYGRERGKPHLVETGKTLSKIGMIIFAVGMTFFDVILGISGRGFGRLAAPIALVALGAYILYTNFATRSTPGVE
ncbi:MAG: hypothetical protein JXB38_16110 [Anaerolineales bacterium]|nr:hypothetical protein [Anaerolineales bacterium]